jgi:hypothetical protein
VALGVEAARVVVGDPGDDDAGGLGRAGQRPVGDGVDEDLAGVVPGQLDPAQQPPEGCGAVLGGELGALLAGEVPGVGEQVEPPCGAFGGGERGGLGEQFPGRGEVGGLLGGGGGDGQGRAGAVGVALVEDRGEQCDRVAVQGLVGPALGGVVDGAGSGHVGGVRVAATGEGDVERGERCPGGDHGVAGVGGAALGGVHGGGVGQVEVLGHVRGGQGQPLPDGFAVRARGRRGGGGDPDVEGAVVADGEDLVGLAVDRAAAVALVAGEVPAVVAGLDEVADPGDGALGQCDAVLGDPAQADEFGAQLPRKSSGGGVVVDQQHRPAPGEGVGEPRSRGGRLGLLAGAGVEQPALLVVAAQHSLVAVAQP